MLRQALFLSITLARFISKSVAILVDYACKYIVSTATGVPETSSVVCARISLKYSYNHLIGSGPGPRHREYTIILDLDETLVHSRVLSSTSIDDGRRAIHFEVMHRQKCRQYSVQKRPFVDEFLSIVSRHFRVVVFTASIKRYADRVIDYLDPECSRIHRRLFRESCNSSDVGMVKDITKVTPQISRTVLVDNFKHAFTLQPDNGVLIPSWTGDENDDHLLRLLPLLMALRSLSDVRSILSLRVS